MPRSSQRPTSFRIPPLALPDTLMPFACCQYWRVFSIAMVSNHEAVDTTVKPAADALEQAAAATSRHSDAVCLR